MELKFSYLREIEIESSISIKITLFITVFENTIFHSVESN